MNSNGLVTRCAVQSRYGVSLIEQNKIKPAIERRYSLRDAADALRHVGEGHAQGQTVIQVCRAHAAFAAPSAR
jgi:D-arabinose 1-dehydrogenase-like Zn-dependent alcohol dehydrogenase